MMGAQLEHMVPFSSLPDPNMLDERPTNCSMGKVYFVVRWRNAWNYSDSRNYFGDGAFHPTFESAAAWVQSRRTQGSVWTIEELPALVIAGSRYALVICEISTPAPLVEHQTYLKSSLRYLFSLADFASFFTSEREDSVKRFYCAVGKVVNATPPFVSHRSKSQGGAYPLYWTSCDYEIDVGPMLEIIAETNSVLSRDGQRVALQEPRPAPPLDSPQLLGDDLRVALRQIVDEKLSGLSERECKVLKWRFGLKGSRWHSLAEIGGILGLPAATIRQTEDEALEKLKHPVRSVGLRHFLTDNWPEFRSLEWSTSAWLAQLLSILAASSDSAELRARLDSWAHTFHGEDEAEISEEAE